MTNPDNDNPGFKAGDIVQLKSGGPKMTVVGPYGGGHSWERGKIQCQWFSKDGTLGTANFERNTLVKCSDDKV